MTESSRPRVGDVVRRTAQIDVRAAAPASRRIPASLSSENPVERLWGVEILSHEPGAIDLSRARGGRLPLLAGHDQAEVPRPGNLENLRVVDGKLRGELVFSETPRGDELLAAVRAGFLDEMSVGYTIQEIQENGRDEDGVSVFRVSKWTPLEASLVNIPADVTVGVGRSIEPGKREGKADVEGQQEQSEDGVRLSRRERRAARAADGSEEQRTTEIVAWKQRYMKQIPELDRLADAAITEGTSVEEFRAMILDRMPAAVAVRSQLDDFGHADPSGLGLTQDEVNRYSFARALYAAGTGDSSAAGLEVEVSRELERRRGDRKREGGILVPTQILLAPRPRRGSPGRRDLTVSGTSSATVATDLLADEFVSPLYNASRVVEAGGRVLEGLVGDVKIPRQSTSSTPYWIDDDSLGSAITESTPSFATITMEPHAVGCLVDVTRRMLIQSTPMIESILRDDFTRKIGEEVDRVAINGSGSGAEPLGLLGTAGIGSVPTTAGAGGAALDWADVIRLEETVAGANVDLSQCSYLTNSAVLRHCKETRKGSLEDRFLIDAREPDFPALNGRRIFVSENVPSDLESTLSALIFGDWRDLLIGTWTSAEIVSDPSTHFASGGLRLRVLQDLDIGVRRPESFAATLDIDTT